MEKSRNSRNDELEKKISQMLAELDNKTRMDILNHISKNESTSFTELMQVTDLETSKLAFHLKKLELLLTQDQNKRYHLSDDGKIAVEMLDYGRKKFGKKQAVLLDKIGEMFRFGEYPRIMKQIVLSPSKGFKSVHCSGYRFLPLALLCVIIPRGLLQVLGEGFKPWPMAIVNWVLFALVAQGMFMLLKKDGAFIGLLSSVGVANFSYIFSALAVGLMAKLPFFSELELLEQKARKSFSSKACLRLWCSSL